MKTLSILALLLLTGCATHTVSWRLYPMEYQQVPVQFDETLPK